MPTDLPWDPSELEAAARHHLTPEAATYYETTAVHPPTRDNERAWAMWRFVPRFGVDVSAVSTATSFFGHAAPAPLLLAPCAFGGYAHPDGEWAAARGAARTGTPYVVSSASTKEQVTVPGASSTPCWCQVYVPRADTDLERVVRGAEESGFQAIVVTVDAPIGSLRRRGYIPDADEHDPFEHARPSASPLNPAVTWRTLERIVGMTQLPVLVKGVLHPGDADAAIEHGVRGVVVSNHGSRQLDGVIPTAAVIEEIAAAVAGRGLVLVDGGVRSGRDVLRALCLGADGALVGRPYLWALAVAGEEGVDLLLRRYHLELENAMALTGCCTVADADRAMVRWYPYSAG
ncbi:MAG TPA: alpha-hydroxy acid oxidase [Acidimicrobiales bacterium]|nr:alpha-hydroxy acid oxidase [Acidimicrobiales bacterium]